MERREASEGFISSECWRKDTTKDVDDQGYGGGKEAQDRWMVDSMDGCARSRGGENGLGFRGTVVGESSHREPISNDLFP